MPVLTVTRGEWLAAAALSLGLMMLVTMPYLLGHMLARPGTFFTGTLMNPEDAQSYFAKMSQGYDGRWSYAIPFTTEPHEPAFLGGFYLALGHFSRLTAISLETVWHLARFASGATLLLATFIFVATHLPGRRARWTAFFMAAFGSGMGWLLFLTGQTYWLGSFPVDFKMPEAHLFFTVLTFPHVALGTAALLFSLWSMGRSAAGGRRGWLYAGLAGFANLAIAILYPFLIILVCLVAGLYWGWLLARERLPWSSIGRLAAAFAIPAPLIIYYAHVERTNAAFHSWAAQAGTPSPPPAHYLVAYGPYLLLALPLVWRRPAMEKLIRSAALPLAWLAAAALLLYGPLAAQRRFVQGVQVPLAIIAAAGLVGVILPALRRTRAVRWLLRRPRYTVEGLESLAVVAAIAVLALSNLYLLADVSLTAAVRQPYPFFRLDEERTAAAWLREAAPDGRGLMAAEATGNYLAAWSGHPVFVGHWAETTAFEAKLGAAARFYDGGTGDAWRQQLLAEHDLGYVWHGPEERRLGDFRPRDAAYLVPVFSAEAVTIYRVRRP